MEDYYSSKFQFHVIELSKIETTKGKESKNLPMARLIQLVLGKKSEKNLKEIITWKRRGMR